MHDEISRITFRAFPQSRGVLRWLGTHFLENTVAHILTPPQPHTTLHATRTLPFSCGPRLGVGGDRVKSAFCERDLRERYCSGGLGDSTDVRKGEIG